MANTNLHVNTPSANRHFPKGFETADLLSYPNKDKDGNYVWSTLGGLGGAAVIDIADAADSPPSTTAGDRYIIVDLGDSTAPHADWDGAAFNDIVEYDGTTWSFETPTVPTLIFVTNKSNWYHLIDPNVTGGEWRRQNGTWLEYDSCTNQTVGATTDETDLHSKTIAEGSLNVDCVIKIEAWGTMTSSIANTCQVRLYFGSTVIANSTAISNDGTWRIEATICIDTQTTQQALGQFSVGSATLASLQTTTVKAAPAEDILTDIVVKVTGQKTLAGDTLDNQGMIVKVNQKY